MPDGLIFMLLHISMVFTDHAEYRVNVKVAQASFWESSIMASITNIAETFIVACEAGKGWNACKDYCLPNATFAAQSEPLADVKSLQNYCEWMTGLIAMMPNCRYELVSFATDDKRCNVCAYAVFHGTHTGPGGPPPTGKSVATDYVYVMQFDGEKIKHMTKIWNSGFAFKALGWS